MMKPNQKNAPYPDELVATIEECAREVVREKKVVRNRYFNIKNSVLSGSNGKYLSVIVTIDNGIINFNEEVETKIGFGKIESGYPSDEGSLKVSIRFNVDDIENYWESK